MLYAGRYDPGHITVHLATFDVTAFALPFATNLRGIHRNSDLSAVMRVTLPYGAVLLRSIEAVVAVILRHVVLWRTWGKPDQELLLPDGRSLDISTRI